MTMVESWALLSPALQTVFAYLDPGTGSLILQGVLAGLATLAVMGRLFWNRILVFLRLKPPTPTTEPSAAAEGTNEKQEPSA